MTMSALTGILLGTVQVLGILLLVILAVLVLALVIPVSVWIAYREEQLTVQAGALSLRYTLLPRPKKEKPEKPKKPKQPQNPKKPRKKAADAPPQDKDKLLKLTFAQLVLLVRGLGTLGRRIVGGIKIRHIRVHLCVTGKDAADTALQYGKLRAWLHTGIGVLNNALWLEFDQFQIDTDFLAEKQKKPAFSCQISTQLLIMVLAALRFLWLLWKENILDALLAKFSGHETK